MGKLINLNRARKRIAREQAEKKAIANRAKFGRTKVEQTIERMRAHHTNNRLEQHRIDRKDDP